MNSDSIEILCIVGGFFIGLMFCGFLMYLSSCKEARQKYKNSLSDKEYRKFMLYRKVVE